MNYPYLLLSDTHHHSWDAFARTDDEGVNSRLKIILTETDRAFEELKKAGGDTAVHAGDMFHVRGEVSPFVLNPTLRCYERHVNDGVKVFAISGNHDLESNDSEEQASLVTALEKVGVVSICSQAVQYTGADYPFAFVSWHHSIADLKEQLTGPSATGKGSARSRDLIIHAPVDGVIAGLPDHGLTAAWLAELGFRRVFAGHYHNHKDFGNGVHSIGALTHQTWNDVGSKAGFLLVYQDRVEYFASHAPQFVDIPSDLPQDEIFTVVSGNYVRVKMENPSQADMHEMREWLQREGAAGVLIQPISTVSSMTGRREIVDKLDSIPVSVSKFAKAKGGEELAKECLDILAEVEVEA